MNPSSVCDEGARVGLVVLGAVTASSTIGQLGLGALPIVAAVLTSRQHQPAATGWLMTAIAVGALLGSLLWTWRSAQQPAHTPLTVMIALIATGAPLAIAAMTTSSLPLTALLFDNGSSRRRHWRRSGRTIELNSIDLRCQRLAACRCAWRFSAPACAPPELDHRLVAFSALPQALLMCLVFAGSPLIAITGAVLWGAAGGVLDSTVKALVADLVPAYRRATAYGVFAVVQGAAAIGGGVMAGALYERSLPILVAAVVITQIIALVLLIATLRRYQSMASQASDAS